MISPQTETAIREAAELFSHAKDLDQYFAAACLTLLAELDVLRGEVERRDELLAGFVNVVDSCDLTVNDEENVEPLLDLARRVIGEEPNE